MVRYCREQDRQIGARRNGALRHTIAQCERWHRYDVRGGRIRRDPCVAEINFFRSRMGSAVVVHEFMHATIAWAIRTRFDWSRLDADDSVNADEESLCYIHSDLVREFVDRAYEAGVY